LVVPSRWFENFPRVLVESFARGTPVIASELGALAEIVNDGENGFVVPPGDADALADRIERALSRPDRLAELGANARVEFERKYSAEPGYRNLMEIYEHAQARAALPATG
jgi:glycosyltransferase involved in cell wall biosynthesis